MEAKERFMKHVRVVNGHWLWTGAVIPNNGYGKVRDPVSRRDMTAHRYSYQLFVGPIPEGVHVLHKHEGMKLCVAPEHLYLGDQVDNSAAYRKTAIRGFQMLEKVRIRLEELRGVGSPESLVRIDELERLL